MKLQCSNPKCKYIWNYQGQSKFYVTCPRCYTKTKIELQGVNSPDAYSPEITTTKEVQE